jgi:hypothetical protein
MRVFVLTTGKAGSTTFAAACGQITNYTSAHESRCHLVEGRCEFPDRHIEVANRLAWFLGTLDRLYGDEPLYVHLTRPRKHVIASMEAQWKDGVSLLRAMDCGILQRSPSQEWRELATLTAQTAEDSIALFLRDKSQVVRAALPDLHPGFEEMWGRIGAEGDLEAAHAELDVRHNKRRRR